MGLGTRRKAIQRFRGRVGVFTLLRVLARLREASNEAGEGGRKKRAPTCSAPMEEYPGKNYQKAGYALIIVSLTEMSSSF